MNARRDRCRLLEPDGTLLARATCHLSPGEGGWTALLTGFDAPGHVVQRCLLDRVHDLWICTDGGVACRARVERVYFDQSLGRACHLRLETGAALLLARALNDTAGVSPPLTPARPAAKSLQVTAA